MCVCVCVLCYCWGIRGFALCRFKIVNFCISTIFYNDRNQNNQCKSKHPTRKMGLKYWSTFSCGACSSWSSTVLLKFVKWYHTGDLRSVHIWAVFVLPKNCVRHWECYESIYLNTVFSWDSTLKYCWSLNIFLQTSVADT